MKFVALTFVLSVVNMPLVNADFITFSDDDISAFMGGFIDNIVESVVGDTDDCINYVSSVDGSEFQSIMIELKNAVNLNGFSISNLGSLGQDLVDLTKECLDEISDTCGANIENGTAFANIITTYGD